MMGYQLKCIQVIIHKLYVQIKPHNDGVTKVVSSYSYK